MGFVLCNGARRQIEHSAERVPDSVSHRVVVGCAIPDGNDVLLSRKDLI